MDLPPPSDGPLAGHAAAVRRLARGLVYDAALAEDVAQEALGVAARRPPAAGRSWGAWLAGIVRNVARNRLRGERRRRSHEAEAARRQAGAAERPEPLEHLARIEEGQRVLAALSRLEEPYRRTLALRYLDDLPVARVALVTGVPLETARTRLRVGLIRLRALLGVGGPGESDRRRRALLSLAGAWPAGLGTVALGGLAVKKALAISSLLLLVGGAWFALTRSEERAQRPAAVATSLSPGGPRLEGRPAEDAPRSPAPPVLVRAVTGRVLSGGTGAPVAGARVSLRALGSAAGARSAEALSDARGAFRLDLPGDGPLGAVLAEAEGHGPAVASVRPGMDVTLSLPGLRWLRGRVHDLEDRPVAGAEVRWISTLEGVPVLRSAVSAADGTYELSVPVAAEAASEPGPPGSVVALRRSQAFLQPLAEVFEARAAGFAVVRVPLARVEHALAGHGLDVLLLRGAVLTGRVLEETTGLPLAGARVFLWGETELAQPCAYDGARPPESGPTYALGQVLSDAQGRYRIESVPAWSGWPVGIHIGSAFLRRLGWVAAHAEGHAIVRREVSLPDDGQELALDLVLPAAGAVRGHVVDPEGRPVPKASVSWVWADESTGAYVDPICPDAPRAWTQADEQGRFVLEGVPCASADASRANLSAQPPGPFGWERSVRAPVAPPPGGTVDVGAVTLPPGPRHAAVDVLVTGAGGVPLAGARVPAVFGAGLSDAQGRLRLTFDPRSAPAGQEQVVSVELPGYRSAEVRATPSIDAPPLVEARLTPGEDGVNGTLPAAPTPAAPPATARLEVLLREAGSLRPVLRGSVRLEPLSAGADLEPTVLGAGRFAFVEPGPGPWRLRVVAPAYEPYEQEVALPSGEPPLTLTLSLRLAGTLRLRLLDRAGAPFADGRLWAQGASGGVQGEIDGAGRATLAGLRPREPYELSCARMPSRGVAQWFVPEPFGPVTAPADGAEVTLTLLPAGVATVRVHGPRLGHESLPNAEQAALRRGVEAALLDASGRAVWSRRHLRGSGWSLFAPPGAYTLRLEVPGAPQVERPVTLTTDPSSVIDIEVP